MSRTNKEFTLKMLTRADLQLHLERWSPFGRGAQVGEVKLIPLPTVLHQVTVSTPEDESRPWLMQQVQDECNHQESMA